MNNDNLFFYKNLGIDPFKEFAIQGGFNSFIDLELIYPYIKQSQSLLELGAGYGRCIDFFLEKKFTGKVFAIEQDPKFIQHLEEKYHSQPNIILVNDDIKSLTIPQKVDAALWMWSGIIDFSPEEQAACVVNVAKHLNDGGHIIIDIPRLGYQTYAQHKDTQNLYLETPLGVLSCYIPSLKDIQKYSSLAGLSHITTLDYKTTTEKERTTYIIRK